MTDCDICAYTEANGHFPPSVRGDHCEKCHTTTSGKSEIHCQMCCRTFGGDSVFQAHRKNDNCRDPMMLKTKDGKHRFRPIERGDRLVWVKVRSETSGSVAKRLESHEGPKARERRVSASVTRSAHRSVAMVVHHPRRTQVRG